MKTMWEYTLQTSARIRYELDVEFIHVVRVILDRHFRCGHNVFTVQTAW